jgi:drug/metabolite transporter (DMT)-like permease
MRGLMAILVSAVLFAASYVLYSGLAVPDESMAERGLIALILGASVGLIANIGLMVRLLYSSRGV